MSHRPLISSTGLLIVLLLCLSGCSKNCNGPAAPDQFITSDGYSGITDAVSDISFKWKVIGSDLSCIISAPVTGWVAVGFGTNVGRAGSNIYIGYVSGGTLCFDEMKGFGNSKAWQHAFSRSGTETGGVTEIRFTVPLNPNDPINTLPLVPGQSYKLLMGSGTADDLAVQQFMTTVVTNKIITL